MKISNDQEHDDIDILKIIEELKETNRTVYWVHIYGSIYIYKPLGRRDHREICEDEDLDTLSKEDEVCKRCLLYPNVDFDDIEAGIVSKLVRTILDNSYITDTETRMQVMDYFRSEMHDLQNQITCIINEAFPQFDIEEIENWDIERTAKYLSRAEWKLQNFRGAQFNYEALEELQAKENGPAEEEKSDDVKVTQSNDEDKAAKEKLDKEKLAELKRKFPEINWDSDVIANEGIDGMKDAVDVMSPALRPGW